MAYDEQLARRIRGTLTEDQDWREVAMFGGLAFMHNGHMCVGVSGETLMVRVGPQQYAAALARPHAREMDFTGRPLKGMIYVDPEGFRTAAALRTWVELGTRFTGSLPPKQPKRKKPAPRGRGGGGRS